MTRRTRWALGAALMSVAVVLTVPAVVGAGPDSSATVRFGNPTVGSPFQPPLFDHDSSFKAADTLIPHTSVISAPGTVTFNIAGFHQPVIYAPGTTPDDIDVPVFDPGPPPVNLFINDFTNLVPGGLGPVNSPPGTTSFPYTFTTPGRYLVICNVTPHFAFGKMYGWVEVK